MKRAKVWVAATATGAVLAALLTSPVLAPVAAAPGDPQRIAFTDDRDELQQVTVFSESDGYTEDLTPGDRVTSLPSFQATSSVLTTRASSRGEGGRRPRYVSTRGDDLDGEVLLRASRRDPSPGARARTFQVTCDNSDVRDAPGRPAASPWTVAFASDVGRGGAAGGTGTSTSRWRTRRQKGAMAPARAGAQPRAEDDLPPAGDDLWPAWTRDGEVLVFSSTTVDPWATSTGSQLGRHPGREHLVNLTDDPARGHATSRDDPGQQRARPRTGWPSPRRPSGSTAASSSSCRLDGTDASVVDAFTTNERDTRSRRSLPGEAHE